MKVLVLGANGKVGSLVSAALLARGHTVIAGVHKNTTAVPKNAVITPITITNQASMLHALKGVDAVVCALSSWQARHHNILSAAMQTLIPAMQQAGVNRIVSISGDMARLPHERVPFFVTLFHTVAFGVIRKVVHDSEDHLRQLQQSNLSWTVLRPTIMTSAKNSAYTLKTTHPMFPLIPRAAVVASIADLVEGGGYNQKAPFIAKA